VIYFFSLREMVRIHLEVMTMKNLFVLGVVVVTATQLLACGPDPTQRVEVERISLSHERLIHPRGITGDPDTESRFVLDGTAGIFELNVEGELRLIWERPEELPVLTDICSVGGGRFVVAADGDGYIVDLASGAASQHFCLEPGWDPGFEEDVRHRNSAVACDLQNRLIYGQPQTILNGGVEDPIRSEIASYSLVSGADQDWLLLPNPEYQAGGMTMLPNGKILLGAGETLSVFDPSSGELVASRVRLMAYGVSEIGGVSYDHSARQVHVLDKADSSITVFPLASLALNFE